jgi:hypothetical protein
MRIMDRSGIYKSLTEVAKKYPVDEFIPRTAAVLTNVYAKFAGAEGIAVIAVEVLGVVSEDPDTLINRCTYNRNLLGR